MTTNEARPLTDAEVRAVAEMDPLTLDCVEYGDVPIRRLLATIDADRKALAEARAEVERLREAIRRVAAATDDEGAYCPLCSVSFDDAGGCDCVDGHGPLLRAALGEATP